MAGRWRSLSCADWFTIGEEPLADSGGWRIEDSALVGYSHVGYYNLTCRDTFEGDLRVEWDATPVRRNQNLNCYIAGTDRTSGYMFHVGGWNNPGVVVLTKGSAMSQLDNARLPSALKVGRTYRICMEKSGQWIRLWVDGRKLFDYRDYDDIAGMGHQSFGFENNNYNRIRLDNVRVWSRAQGRDSSLFTRASRYYIRRDYPSALSMYRLLAGQVSDADTGAQIAYRTALCLEALDSVESALKAYRDVETRFAGHAVCPLSAGRRGAIYDSRADTAAAMQVYREMGARYPGHAVLKTVFFNACNARMARRAQVLAEWVRDSADDGSAGRWLLTETVRMRDLGKTFGLDLSTDMFVEQMAELLVGNDVISIERAESLIPEARGKIANAYVAQGASHVVVARYPDVADMYADALCQTGRLREVLARPGAYRPATAEALLRLGRHEELLENYTDQRGQALAAAMRTGRFELLKQEYPDAFEAYTSAGVELGRASEFFAKVGPEYFAIASTLFYSLNKPLVALLAIDGAQVNLTFRDFVVQNDCLRALGRHGEAFARFARTPMMEVPLGYNLLAMGRPDLVVSRYPKVLELRSRVLLCRGDFDSVTVETVGHRVRLQALLLSGNAAQVKSEYRNSPAALGALAISQADYKGLLKQCRDMRLWRAQALNALGRYDEVLSKYPDQRRCCAQALIAKGRLDEALGQYPESRALVAQALLLNNRWDEVATRFADQPHESGQALVELGRYAEVVANRSRVWPRPDQVFDLRARIALREWSLGNRAGADSILQNGDSTYSHMWNHLRVSRHLLLPVLHGLAGDTAALALGCQAVLENPIQMYSRRLWFEAAYIAGRIDDSTFLAQPCRYRADSRLVLFRAIRADLNADTRNAVRGYREWLTKTGSMVPLYENLSQPNVAIDAFTDLDQSATLRRFAQWRVDVLTGHAVGSES